MAITLSGSTITIDSGVPAAQVVVVVNGPAESVQTVERDANDEITRTVTRHTYS